LKLSLKTSFKDLNLNEALVSALKVEGIHEATTIQEKSIPLILSKKDLIGQSETGSGKTLAYLLPMFQMIETLKRETQILILTPTHELALQIHRQIERLVQNSHVFLSSAVIIGNVNITRQIEKLKEKPQVLVGSSGRILELIQKRKINAQTIKAIILDEADRLLDDNNLKTVEAVIKTTLRDRQLLCFSATITPITLERIKALAKNPEFVSITPQVQVAPTITHQFFLTEQRDKFEVLRKLVRIINPERALVFINKSEEIKITVEKLKYHGLEAAGIHGSTEKAERRKAMHEFQSGKFRLLVASDLAARGLDIQGITHVFNVDFPEDPQLYLHRVGRTGRAGQSGLAISLINEKELSLLKKVEKQFKIHISLKAMHKGDIIDSKRTTQINKRPILTEKSLSEKNRPPKDSKRPEQELNIRPYEPKNRSSQNPKEFHSKAITDGTPTSKIRRSKSRKP
jgi:ATP-dependent RNA helicase DeaD